MMKNLSAGDFGGAAFDRSGNIEGQTKATEHTRLVSRTLECEFIEDQVNRFMAGGGKVWVPMPALKTAFLVTGASKASEGALQISPAEGSHLQPIIFRPNESLTIQYTQP